MTILWKHYPYFQSTNRVKNNKIRKKIYLPHNNERQSSSLSLLQLFTIHYLHQTISILDRLCKINILKIHLVYRLSERKRELKRWREWEKGRVLRERDGTQREWLWEKERVPDFWADHVPHFEREMIDREIQFNWFEAT